MLKAADPDAIATLRQVFEEAMMLGGGNPTDAVDCVIAACREQWRQEEEPTNALSFGHEPEDTHAETERS